MAKRVVIDVVAQFKDETQGVQKVSKNLDNLEKAGKRARKSISDLSRTKASPKIDANSSKFEQRMKKSEDRARNFGRSKFETLISVRDRATEYIEKAAGKAKDFAGRSYDAFPVSYTHLKSSIRNMYRN